MKRIILLLGISMTLVILPATHSWASSGVNSQFDAVVARFLGNYQEAVSPGDKAYLFVSSRTNDLAIGPIVMIMDLADIAGTTKDYQEGFITFYAVLGSQFAQWIPSVSTGIFTRHVGDDPNGDPPLSGGNGLAVKAVVTGEVKGDHVKPSAFSNATTCTTLSLNAWTVEFEVEADFFWRWFADHYNSPNEPTGVADMLFNIFGPLSEFDAMVARLATDPSLYRADDTNPETFMPLGVAFGEGNYPDKLQHLMSYIHDLGLHRTKVSFYWSELEPEPGKFDFERLDLYLDQLDASDQALVNLFTNGWCTHQDEEASRKGATLRECPNDSTPCEKSCEEYYLEFVKRVAQRVKERAHGGVKYFQRDTEPASGLHFPASKPEEYVELQKLFYSAVKAVLPSVTVIGVNHNGNFKAHDTGPPSSQEFFDYVLEHMRDYYDALDVRLYSDYQTIPHRVEWFRERMRRFGYEKPVLSTEHGGPDPRSLHDGEVYLFEELSRQLEDICPSESLEEFFQCANTWMHQHPDQLNPKLRAYLNLGTEEENDFREVIHCHDITQRNIVMLAEGIEATWWWNLRSPGKDPIFGQMRLRDDLLNELPGYACYKRLVQHMRGVVSVKRVDLDDENINLFQVDKQSEPPSFVAWYRNTALDPFDAAKAEPVSVKLPIPYQQVTVTDVFGHTETYTVKNGVLDIVLGDKPVFIER